LLRAAVATRAIAVAVAGSLLLACASVSGSPNPDLARVWRDFLALPEQRALAIAGDPRRDRWVSGSSGGHASLEDAEEGALAECRRWRAQRRMQDACQTYAVGEEVVWTGPR
jgi:hypothetical protein